MDLEEYEKNYKEISTFIRDNPPEVYYIGFWKCFGSEDDRENLPIPIKNTNILNKEETQDFIHKLEIIEEKTFKIFYLGHSQCRICLQENGSFTHYYKYHETYTKTQKLFIFPQGYKHYITEHNIRIDDEMYKMVMEKYEKFNIEDID